jgi:hypothetical protein
MENQENPDQSPESFLADLGKRLSERDGEDAELTAILKTHLLKVSPANDAVARAMADIKLMADQRANPLQVDGTDG